MKPFEDNNELEVFEEYKLIFPKITFTENRRKNREASFLIG